MYHSSHSLPQHCYYHWYYSIRLWFTLMWPCVHLWKIPKLPLRGLQHFSFIPHWPTCRTRQWHNPECCETTKQQNLWKQFPLSASDVLKELQLLTVFQPAAPPLLPPQSFNNPVKLIFTFDDGEILGLFPPEIDWLRVHMTCNYSFWDWLYEHI